MNLVLVSSPRQSPSEVIDVAPQGRGPALRNDPIPHQVSEPGGVHRSPGEQQREQQYPLTGAEGHRLQLTRAGEGTEDPKQNQARPAGGEKKQKKKIDPVIEKKKK